jgi:hypothetical protein
MTEAKRGFRYFLGLKFFDRPEAHRVDYVVDIESHMIYRPFEPHAPLDSPRAAHPVWTLNISSEKHKRVTYLKLVILSRYVWMKEWAQLARDDPTLYRCMDLGLSHLSRVFQHITT